MSRHRRRRVPTTIWVLLWGDLSAANVASGVLLAVLLLAVFPRTPSTTGFVVRPLPTLRFLLFFAARWSGPSSCSALRC